MTTVSIAMNPSAQGPIQVDLHLIATLDVTPEEARKRVNRRVVSELGTGLIARDPELTVNGDLVSWRVPVALSLPRLGDLGQIGAVDVDAHTGEIRTDDAALHKIIQHANTLYAGATLAPRQ